jgi:hypothetical protein
MLSLSQLWSPWSGHPGHPVAQKRRGTSQATAGHTAAIVFYERQWIGLRENLQETPIFNGKIYGFL